MLTRGMIVTVSSSRTERAQAEPAVSARTISTAELLTTYSSPCWLAMIIIPRGPCPMVTIGIARPLPFARKGEYVSSAAAGRAWTMLSSVAISWS